MTSVPRPPSVPPVSPGDTVRPVSPCPPSPYRGDTEPGDTRDSQASSAGVPPGGRDLLEVSAAPAPFPPLHEYAMAKRCPVCRAEPGQDCQAPHKAAQRARAARLAAMFGVPYEEPPLSRLHKARQQAGARHYRRDVGNAPWPEDREPGRRYDTLKETP